MKTLITTAVLALSVLGANAASAAPWFHPRALVVRHDVVRVVPRPHVWVRGERFVPAFGRPIIVRDWGRYHLRRPPYGYRWVREGDRFLLVALTTGLIADIIANGSAY